MKPRPLILAFCLLCHQAVAQQIEVYFSPKGGCTEAAVRELDAAKTSVLVQAYSFTSAPIAKALVNAHKRGAKIEVILDKSQRTEKYSEADFLHNMGIPVTIDAKHAIAHNKIIVVDDAVVITGSFNFTRAAEESNAENLLVIHDKALAAKYTGNWRAHAGHSEPYVREKAYSETAQDGFVASVNSKVFHRPGCKSAAKIAEKNLVRYASREEAIKAGKTPCAQCSP
jgi:phosphatidylserine/phosphatidylglycerophosphate/cardiolipin synthase-like enzyme